MAVEVTITDLQRDTGETARQLQYWSDLGVFRPLPYTNKRGRGVQRLFPADPPLYGERAWALIASEMNRWRIPIGVIKDIIDTMREIWGGPDGPLGRALAGEQVLVLIALNDGEAPMIAALKLERPEHPPTVERVFEKGLLGEAHTEDWPVYGRRTVVLPDEFLADHVSGHLLNLTKVLRPLASTKARSK